MTPSAPSVALLGATGAVGEEVLRLLQERRFPVSELRLFASEDSVGIEIDFLSESLFVEPVNIDRVAGCDLVINAARDLDDEVVPALIQRAVLLVDLTGALEALDSVPLYIPGLGVQAVNVQGASRLAVPRGITGGLALTLSLLCREAELRRVTVLTLEGASGAGRRGLGELSDQTITILNAMSGAEIGSNVFPASLAFNCLPAVGSPEESGETSEEARMRLVLRRALRAPELPVEVTRVRVPVFMGSMAAVHVELDKPVELQAVRRAWDQVDVLELLAEGQLPTPRTAVGTDAVVAGRLRHSGSGVAYVLAMDDLRRGSALTAIEAAAALVAS
jgi:aspartate-semialdehyde dehydrogenase